MVAAALARHGSRLEVRDALRAVGGLELAALAGAIGAAAPGIDAGRARRLRGGGGRALRGATRSVELGGPDRGHRSAEPGHDLVLAELGLEPVLDLRLRLGEASGGLLALPVIEAAAVLFREMATFREAGVDGP